MWKENRNFCQITKLGAISKIYNMEFHYIGSFS